MKKSLSIFSLNAEMQSYDHFANLRLYRRVHSIIVVSFSLITLGRKHSLMITEGVE